MAKHERPRVAFSGEVVWALDIRRQGGRYLHGAEASHYTPETPEELERANQYTAKLQELMQDALLGSLIASELMPIADGMMADGIISEEQYLKVHDMFDRVSMGDSYHPLDTPKSYIERFGSIYEQSATQPTK